MRNRKMKHKVIATVMAIGMALTSLTGCTNGLSQGKLTKDGGFSKKEAASTKVMVIGDQDIYMNEMLFYASQYLMMNKGTVDAVKNNPTQFSEGTISLIRTTKILYDVTTHNDVALTEDEKSKIDASIGNYKTSMSEAFLKKYGITDDVIERAFMEQAYVSKFESQIKNDMGENAKADILEKCKDYNFVIFDYLLFPTVEINENDEPATTSDGGYATLSDAQKEDVKEQAQNFIEELRNGGDCEALQESYGIKNYSQEMSGYVGSYKDILNDALEDLKAGECSEILETTLGYLVLYVKSDHDEKLKENYAYALAADVLNEQFEKLEQQWLSSVEVDPEKDMEGTVWADYDLVDMATDLENAGLIVR